jgi:hypothetical protein
VDRAFILPILKILENGEGNVEKNYIGFAPEFQSVALYSPQGGTGGMEEELRGVSAF